MPTPASHRPRNRREDADTNVGLLGGPRLQRPGKSPQFGLARSVLGSALRSVLRYRAPALTLGLSMLSLSGCVLPLSPDFQDPPAPQNYAPQIISAEPLQGSIGTSTTFMITVKDQDLSSDIWIRWIGEYPPYSVSSRPLTDQDVMFSHSINGQPLVDSTSVTVNCFELAPLMQHPIMALVSDRAFLPRDTPDVSLETLLTGASSSDAQMAEAHWVLNLDCTQ